MTAEKRRKEISVQIGDVTYHGTFKNDAGVVTVLTAYGSKSKSIGTTPDDTAARELLRDLVLERGARKRPST